MKPVTRKEAYWAAMADDSITPPEPQTTEECILAAMSGNYPADKIKPQTREQELMKQAAVKMGTLVEQNVEFANDITDFALKTAIKKVVIPDGTTQIGANAFNGMSAIETIVIPESVTSIGGTAFGYCTNLKSITIPESVTSIGATAFSSCSALETIIFPANITEIPSTVCSGCTSLKHVTFLGRVTTFGSSSFGQCKALESFTIPESVTKIDGSCFGYCSNLKTVTFLCKGEGLTLGQSNSPVFSGCTALTDIYVPWSEGEVANAPWGATNATIHYNYTGE